MKATPLIINWHESNSPIYSADFQKGDKGRLATGAGDNNVRVRTHAGRKAAKRHLLTV
jgi:chromatin assembly factor 1 subunit B